MSSDEEGFHGAWFQGTVVKSVGHKFLVEYDALKDDDEITPLKETIGEEHIRPSPPAIPVTNGFKVLDEIDAYTNDGWWVGVVSEVLGDQKYKVYFKAYKEQNDFEVEQLRRHCDWVGGRWMQASLVITSTAYPFSPHLSSQLIMKLALVMIITDIAASIAG